MVALRLNACFAPSVVVDGSEEVMRSAMKDCADASLDGVAVDEGAPPPAEAIPIPVAGDDARPPLLGELDPAAAMIELIESFDGLVMMFSLLSRIHVGVSMTNSV